MKVGDKLRPVAGPDTPEGWENLPPIWEVTARQGELLQAESLDYPVGSPWRCKVLMPLADLQKCFCKSAAVASRQPLQIPEENGDAEAK